MSGTIEATSTDVIDRPADAMMVSRSSAGRSPVRDGMDKEVVWSAPDAAAGNPSVAVLIPCLNEAASIGRVIADFRAALQDATIYVYDNNSTDRTVAVARMSGAVVRSESLRGKGNVVRRMFADIDADVYVLVDGDDTYDARAAPEMMRLLLERRLDMVSAARDTPEAAAYRPGHKVGNPVLSGMVRLVFGTGITDMLSGYRAFSRRFVKSFPALANGFETETEFTVHALALRMPVMEIVAPYRCRSDGSASKLSTYSDGLHILREIVALIEHERPLPLAVIVTSLLLTLALGLGMPVVVAFLHTGFVDRLPTAVLASSLVLLAALNLGCGLILNAITHGRTELKRLAYLAIPFPRGP